MGDESATRDARLRDGEAEAEAFRTGRTLAEYGQELTRIREQQRSAFTNIDSLADAIGSLGERILTQRLDTVTDRLDTVTDRLGTVTEQLGTVTGQLGTVRDCLDTFTDRLDTVERVLFALARAQGIDPETTG
ncbi:hypothetical protein GCM10010129_76750 [Streptomyces fumigatiscleroticus]|nr:hypothetical protein GCM10010129_76750 [Streptomyces fumigatiscleroticus]